MLTVAPASPWRSSVDSWVANSSSARRTFLSCTRRAAARSASAGSRANSLSDSIPAASGKHFFLSASNTVSPTFFATPSVAFVRNLERQLTAAAARELTASGSTDPPNLQDVCHSFVFPRINPPAATLLQAISRNDDGRDRLCTHIILGLFRSIERN